jgi:hypothetical protein
MGAACAAGPEWREYMHTADLSNIPQKCDHLLFSDAVQDNLHFTGSTLWACGFRRIGARNASFEQSSLTQCFFEDSYFRKASFRNVDLTGSTFRGCNLEKATFQGCNFRYCAFQMTRLDPNEIIGCLPVEPNLRRDLARNLRKNFEGLGDKVTADVFLNLEIEAYEQELLGAFRRKTEYYRSHYSNVDQAVAGLKYLASKLSGIVWGYGHRVSRLLVSYTILSTAFALITYFCRFPFSVDGQTSIRVLGFWESMYYTFAGTLCLSVASLTPVSAIAKALQLCETFLGTLFLALLAAAAYRKISR